MQNGKRSRAWRARGLVRVREWGGEAEFGEHSGYGPLVNDDQGGHDKATFYCRDIASNDNRSE